MSDLKKAQPHSKAKKHFLKNSLKLKYNTQQLKTNEIYQILMNNKNLQDNKEIVNRKDYIIYSFNFLFIRQAIAMILFFSMIINCFWFLVFSLTSNPNIYTSLSWIIFTEFGFFILFGSITISKINLIKERTLKNIDSPDSYDKKYAFFHAFTWYFCAIYLAYLSTKIYLLYVK